MDELTPEEAALYDKLYGPDAPKPASRATRLGRTYLGPPRSAWRSCTAGAGVRPGAVRATPRGRRRAELLCGNRPGRPYVLAVVTTLPEGVRGSVVTVNPDGAFGVLGHDFRVECPCGMTHEVTGPATVRRPGTAPHARARRRPSTCSTWSASSRTRVSCPGGVVALV